MTIASPEALIAERSRTPTSFQNFILNRRLWRKQREIVRAAAFDIETSCKGCHASGKTFGMAGAILYQLKKTGGKVLHLAPTLRQVKLMWEEVELARQQSIGLIDFPPCTTTGLRISENQYGIGFSAAKGVNAQGFHGGDVLIVVDEAPGILGEVWDAIEGIRAGGRVRLLKLGNPTVPSGPFFDDFSKNRSSVKGITISAFDTPNLQNQATGNPYTIEQLLEMDEQQLGDNPVPYLVTKRWVRDRYLRWGPNNPRYMSRVLGEFPTQSEYAVFSLEWIERAQREPLERESAYALANRSFIQVGIDVAGPGEDETACCARVNGMIVGRGAWGDKDPRGKVVQWLNSLRSLPYPLGVVMVDVEGIGYNFALHLVDQGFEVMGFRASHAPIDRERFKNAKSEAYFSLRDAYQQNYVSHCAGTIDEETEAQLSGVLYRPTSRGLTQVEPKEDARKRGVSSPDRAEAEILAFTLVRPREQTITF